MTHKERAGTTKGLSPHLPPPAQPFGPCSLACARVLLWLAVQSFSASDSPRLLFAGGNLPPRPIFGFSRSKETTCSVGQTGLHHLSGAAFSASPLGTPPHWRAGATNNAPSLGLGQLTPIQLKLMTGARPDDGCQTRTDEKRRERVES